MAQLETLDDLQSQEASNRMSELTRPEWQQDQQPAFQDHLADSKAYQNERNVLSKMLADPENLAGQANEAVKKSNSYPDPQGFRDMAVNMRALSFLTGYSLDTVAENYDTICKGYAASQGWQDSRSDTDFRSKLANQFQDADLRNAAFKDIQKQAVNDAMQEPNTSLLQRFAEWNTKNASALGDMTDSDRLKAFIPAYNEARAYFSDPKLSSMAKQIVDTYQDSTQKEEPGSLPGYQNPLGTLGSKKLPTGSPEENEKLMEAFTALSPEQRSRVGAMAQLYAQAKDPNASTPGFTGALYSLGAALINSTGDILHNIPRAAEEVMLSGGIDANDVPVGGYGDKPPNEQQADDAKIERLRAGYQLQQIAQNQVNPLAYSNVSWTDSLPAAATKIGQMAAQTVPYLAGLGLGTVPGALLMGASTIANIQQQYLSENPNMGVHEAALIGTAIGTPVAALQSLSLGGVNSMFPALEQTIGKYAAEGTWRNVLLHASVGSAGAISAEFTEVLGNAASKAIDKDLNPDQNTRDQLVSVVKEIPMTLGLMGAFALFHAGKPVDQNKILELSSNSDSLRVAGIPEAEAERIASADPSTRLEELKKALDSRTPASIEDGISYGKTLAQKATVASGSSDGPRLLTYEDGTHVITAPDGNGIHRETFRTSDPDAAANAYQIALSDHEQAKLETLRQTIEHFKNADVAQGLDGTRTYETVPKERTFQDELNEGASLESLRERMRIAGMPEDTKLSDVLVEGMTTREVREGVLHDVVTVLNNGPETAIHERLDASTMRVLQSGKVTPEEMTRWVRQTEDATGNTYLPKGRDPSVQELVEAVTEIGLKYVLGHAQEAAESPKIASPLKGFFKSLVAYFKDVMKRAVDAKALRDSFRQGKITGDFEEHLARSVGLPIEERLAPAEAKAKANLMGEKVDGTGELQQGTLFSVRSKENAARKEIISQTGIDQSGLDFLRKAVGNSAENLEKKKSRREGTGVAKNKLTRFEDQNGRPIVVGADAKHGGKPYADWIAENEQWLKSHEIADFRKWYTELKGNFTHLFGEDAPTMMMAWLAAQQNVSPSGALHNVFKVEDRLAGIGTGKKGGLADEKIQGILTNEIPEKGFGQKLTDFVDAGFGRSTRTYMGENPEGGMPFVADVHTGRDSGHVDQQTLTRLKEMADDGNLFVDGKPVSIDILESKTVTKKMDDGTSKNIVQPERISVKVKGRKPFEMFVDQRGSPSEGNYEGISEWGNSLTDHLNQQGWEGGNWNPAEAQAVGWMRILRQYGLPEPTVATALAHNTTHIYAEVNYANGSTLPSAFPDLGTLPKQTQVAITHEVLSKTVNELANIIGGSLRVRSVSPTYGRWGGVSNPSTVIETLGSAEAASILKNALALVSEQGGTMSAIFEKGGKASSAIFFHPTDGGKLTPEQLDSLANEAGISGMTVQPYRDGERVMLVGTKKGTFMPKGLTETQRDTMTENILSWADRHGLKLTLDRIQTTIDANENDWKIHPDGESYRKRLIDGGGSSKVRAILDFRRRYAEIVNDAFERHAPESLTGSREERLARFPSAYAETLGEGSNLSNAPPEEFGVPSYSIQDKNKIGPGININDSEHDFTGKILSGAKTIETRDTRSLDPWIGKRVGLVSTGNGKAKHVGFAELGTPKFYPDAQSFRDDEGQHQVPEGSKFDITDAGKWGYPLSNVEKIAPRDVLGNGIVSRATRFSISTRAERDRINDELLRRINENPDSRVQIYERMAANLKRIQGDSEKLKEQFSNGEATSRDVSDYRLKQSLAEINAIISALPPEVRATLTRNWRNPKTNEPGNIYSKYSSLQGDPARADFLIKTIDRASELLDHQLSGEYLDRGYRLLDAAEPKNERGKGLQGKLGSDTHNALRTVRDLWHMDAGQVADYINSRQRELVALDSGDNTKNPEETDNERERLANEIVIAQIHGNFSPWDEAGNLKAFDNPEMDSTGRFQAVEQLKEVIHTGRAEWNATKDAQRANWQQLRSLVKSLLLGREGDATSAEITKSREQGEKWTTGISRLMDTHLTRFQILDKLLGEDMARSLKLRILKATNDKFDLDHEVDSTSHGELIRAIYGPDADDNLINRTRLKQDIARLSTAKNTGAEARENLNWVKTKVLRSVAEGYTENPLDWKGTDSELNYLTRTLKGLKDSSRAKYVEIYLPENEGQKVPLLLSEMEAIQRLLSWRQPDARIKQERSGMTQETVDALEKFVNKTKEGRAFYDYLKNAYDQYDKINAVYSRMFGVDMPRVKNYAPTVYDTAKGSEDPVNLEEYGGGGGSMPSFGITRQNHAAKIKDANAWATYQAHMDAVNYWLTHAELVRDLRATFGNADVLRAAEVKDPSGRQNLINLIKVLGRDNSTVGNLTAFNNRFTRAASDVLGSVALAYNTHVTLKHIIPSLASAMKMDAGTWVMSALRVASGMAERSPFGKDGMYSSAEVERFYNAAHSGSDANAIQAAREGWFAGSKIAAQAVGHWGHSWITEFVRVSNSISGAIAYDGAYRDAIEAGLNEAEAHKEASTRVDEILHETSQPMFGVDRPVGDENNPLMATVARFAGPVRQRMGIVVHETSKLPEKLKNAEGIGGKAGAAGDFLWKMAMAWVIPGLLEHAVAQGYYAMLGTKQQQSDANRLSEYLASAISGPLYGVYWAGPVLVASIKAALTHEKNFFSTANPLLDSLTSAYQQIGKVIKHPTQASAKDYLTSGKAAMAAVSMILGLIGQRAGASAIAGAASTLNPVIMGTSKITDRGVVKHKK